jgi:CRISPR-associated protein Cas2
MRKRYVVCYDISDPKRLAKVLRKMKGFGDPLQLSVFQCDLSRQEVILLKMALLGIINERHDRVLIIDLGPATGRGKECTESLGKREPPSDRNVVVV